MNRKTIQVLKLIGLGISGFCLTAIMVPHECSREEEKYLEQFQYITHQEGYKKPKKGEFTFYPTNGPVAGGSISALMIDDQTVYAGMFGDGIYRKNPVGDLWEPLSKGIKDPFVLSLSKTKEGILIAGTIKGGIFRSSDKGKTWAASNNGLTNFEVTSIYEYKNDIFIGTGGGVFKSKDQGLTWDPLNKGMESILVKAFLIDHSGAYFAGTGGQGIFRSDDKGKNWERVEFKLEGETGLNENYIRVISQSHKKFLYAGTFGGGIFRSTDGGRKWLPVNSGLTNSSIRTLQVAQDGTLITGTGEGVFISSNEGENWISINGDLGDKNIQSMMLTKDHVYIGTASAVFRKKLQESHWAPLDKGITYPVVLSLTGDAEKGFYAGTDGEGVYRSKDGGYSWFPMNEGMADMSIRYIMEDPSHTLYILTGDGVFKGDRIKKSWVPMAEGIGQNRIHSLFLDSENNLFSGTDMGLYKRDMTSNYWEKIVLPVDVPIKWIAGEKEKLFAISDHDVFLLKKGDTMPLPVTFPQIKEEIRGAIFRENLYIWSGRQVFEGKNLNQELSWKIMYELPAGLICQAMDIEMINGKETFFVGTDKGAFWSDNHGESWHVISGAGANANVKSFFSPYPGTLLLGTGDRGIWVGIGF